jgi:hypothetical protein
MTILFLFFTILMAFSTAHHTINKRYGWAAFSLVLFIIDATQLAGLLNG